MIPKALYELLPFGYFLLAIALIWVADHPSRWIPALLFILCGILTLKWRRQHRQSVRQNF